jgi:transposase
MPFILPTKMKDGSIHVYYVTSRRVPGLKYPKQLKKYLGVFSPDTGELLLGRNTPEPDGEVLKALKTKKMVYSGNRAASPGRHCRQKKEHACGEDFRESYTIELGRVLALEKLAESAGLAEALGAAFGEDAHSILSVAICQCAEETPMYRVENLADETCLRERALSLSPSSLSRLCDRVGISGDNCNVFFREWIRRRKNPSALIHDTTSISGYAERFHLLEWGYNRDGEALPQVNFALVVSKEDKLPLYYRLVYGSIPDVATLAETSHNLMEFGLKHFSFALDRGYFSMGNLRFMMDNNLGFTIGVPLGQTQSVRLLNNVRPKLNSFKSAFQSGKTVLRHAEAEYAVQAVGKGQARKLKAHVYLNIEERARLLAELDQTLLGLQKKFALESFKTLTAAKEWCEEELGPYKDYFRVTVANGAVSLSLAEKTIKGKMDKAGIFMLLDSSPTSTAQSTLEDNKSRDTAEKIFCTLKNFTGNNRLKGFSDQNVTGRLFIAFITVTLYKILESKLREKGLLGKYSVQEALDLLRKIKLVAFKDGKRYIQEIPRKTQQLLAVLDLDLNLK